MFRLVFTLIGVVLLGLGAGYFMWGGRVANLTESLNGMVLEQEALRARLTAFDTRSAFAATAAANELAADPNAAQGDGVGTGVGQPSVSQALTALKNEVQYQGKLINEQTNLLNLVRESGQREGGVAIQTCRENTRAISDQLDSCNSELDQIKTRFGITTPSPY